MTQKRDDGYHNIDTVFYPLPLQDALEFVESKDMKFDTSGLEIPGNTKDNIVLKAYELVKNEFPSLPNLHIHLHKKIPTGGGLGGGSSDAASMLKMLNESFNLNLNAQLSTLNSQLSTNNQQLSSFALKLGSDCPFFLYNKPCHATGRGEILTPVSIDLSDYHFILIFPNIHIKTADAFSQLTPSMPLKLTNEIVQQPVSTWKHELKNDFEEPIFKAYPVLKKIKETLYDAGAVYSAMSGSGSTMYALVEKVNIENTKKKIEKEKLFEGLGVYYV